MTEHSFIVEGKDAGKRLDKYLCEKSELTRSRVQQLIDEKQVRVNDKETKCNYKVKSNDEITLFIPDSTELKVEPQDIPLDIVYEDDDVIVINKPRGMVVHPAAGNLKDTLVNALLFHCKDLSGINGVMRPGIVHRIDKDTSGLIIVAKNDKAHLSLSEQLQKKEVSRKYLALVHGVIEEEYGTIDAPIGRDQKDRKRMAVTAINSKHAVTHFRVLERFKDYTLVECILETGRTHQIRVHMAYIKHPIVGDETYAYRKTMSTGGQLLHAYELRFVHPTSGKEIVVNAEMPEIFKKVLEDLRNEEQ